MHRFLGLTSWGLTDDVTNYSEQKSLGWNKEGYIFLSLWSDEHVSFKLERHTEFYFEI